VTRTSLDKRLLMESDILIAASGAGPLGRSLWASTTLASLFQLPLIYSNFCKRLRAETPEIAIFLDRHLHLLHKSGRVWEYASGTAVPNLDLSGLLSGEFIPFPDEGLPSAFARIVRPIYCRLYSSESASLAALRDALLPKLLSGDIRVTEADAD